MGPLDLLHQRLVVLERHPVGVDDPVQHLQADQGVLVGGVAVEELVLHQAGERGELGEEAAQDAQLVHPAEGLAHLPLAPDHGEDELAHLLQVAEVPVDVAQPSPDAQGELGRELHVVQLGQVEGLHQTDRLGTEEVGALDLDLPVLDDEAVDLPGPGTPQEGPARLRLLRPGQPLRQGVADQVELAGVPVVLPHHRLGPAQDVRLGIFQAVGHLPLQLQGEDVVAPLAQGVHLGPHVEDVVVGRLDLLALARLEELLLLEARRGADAVLHLGDPEQVLVVAQAAAAVLHVRLLDEDGVAVFGVAVGLLPDAPGQVFLLLPLAAQAFLRERLLELVPKLLVAADVAPLQERGLGLQVGVGLVHQLGQGPARRGRP